MPKTKLEVTWTDYLREPQCPPDPDFPTGKDVDLRTDPDAPSCRTALGWPAPRCGMYVVYCPRCGYTAGITTAGRPDDPRSVTIPCKPH